MVAVNQRIFPPGYTPCNIIRSQRIHPFTENIRRLLVDKYCPPKIAQQIMSSKPDKDSSLVRPYLGHSTDHISYARRAVPFLAAAALMRALRVRLTEYIYYLVIYNISLLVEPQHAAAFLGE